MKKKLMENDFELRNRYLEQYLDIYGQNLYLSQNLVNENNIIKGGSKFTAFYNIIRGCKNCSVDSIDSLGVGSQDANIIFIVEAIQKKYNIQFDGKFGKIFIKILSAIQLSFDNVFIINFFQDNSTNNDFSHYKSQLCEFHFKKQLQIINPKLIVALGENIGNSMLLKKERIEKLNSKMHKFNNFDVLVTYNPKLILENQDIKKPIWEDFKKIRNNYL